MEEDGNRPTPALLVATGTLVLGLASFVVWLLRLQPRVSDGQPVLQMPERRRQPDTASAGVASVSLGLEAQNASRSSTPVPVTAEKASSAALASAGAAEVEGGAAPQASSRAVPGATTRWSAPSRYIGGAGLILALLGLVYFSRQTLTLLIFAALISALAQPAMGFLRKRLHFSTGLAVMTTYLVIAVVLFALPLLMVPNIIQGFNSLIRIDWPGIAKSLMEGLEQAAAWAASVPLVGGLVSGPIHSLTDFLRSLMAGMPEVTGANVTVETMLGGVGRAVGLLVGILGPVVSAVLSFIFLLLISLQMSLAGDQVRGWIMQVVPPRFEAEIDALLDRISFVWVSFLRGQFALMVVMGLLVWLMNSLLGTPQALLLGLLAGLLEIVPSLGPTLAAVPAALLALFLGSAHFPDLSPLIFMLIVIAAYVLLNLLENQVLVPKILGDAVNLPPLIVLVGATIGGVQAGIAGIFLATPVIATGRELFHYVYAKIRDAPELDLPEERQPTMLDRLRRLAGRIRLPFRRRAERVRPRE